MTKTEEYLQVTGVTREELCKEAVSSFKALSSTMIGSDDEEFMSGVNSYIEKFEKAFYDRSDEIIAHMKRMLFEFYTDEQLDDLLKMYKKHPDLIANQRAFTKELMKVCMQIGNECGQSVNDELF